LRMRCAGYKTRYVAAARVVHHLGASTGQFRTFVAQWQRDRLAYYRKHFGRLAGVWVKACVTLTFADWAVRQLAARLRRRPSEPVGPTWRVYCAFVAE